MQPIRKPRHKYPIVNYLEGKHVLRGPYSARKLAETLHRYQLLSHIMGGEDIYLPSQTEINNCAYLIFPFVKKGPLNWGDREYRKLLIEQLIFRFLLGAGAGSFDNILIYRGKIVHMNLDVPKLSQENYLIQLILTEIDALELSEIDLFIHEEIYHFQHVVEGIDHELLRKNQLIIKSILQTKNINKPNLIFIEEGGKKPRTTKKEKGFTKKMKEQISTRNLSLAMKFNSFKKEIVLQKHTTTYYDFSHFLAYSQVISIEVFRMFIFQFMFEYLSIKDILTHLSRVNKWLKKLSEANLYKIYRLLNNLEHTQELFIESFMLRQATEVTWNDINWKRLTEIKDISQVINYFSLQPQYFKILSEYDFEETDQLQIDNDNIEIFEIEVKNYPISRIKNLLYTILRKRNNSSTKIIYEMNHLDCPHPKCLKMINALYHFKMCLDPALIYSLKN